MGNKLYARLKALDAFKKLPSDLTEATLTGAWISIAATVIMVMLFFMELSAFATIKTTSQLIVDKSHPSDKLQVKFNVSFPELSCEFAAVDISDALGTKKMNITKNILKTPLVMRDGRIERGVSKLMDESAKPVPKYDDVAQYEKADFDIEVNHALTSENFDKTLARYPIVVVAFMASWCIHCQRLAPSWEAASRAVHDKYPEWDGRIRFAKVECVEQEELCNRNFINAFPSIRVFRTGHDDVEYNGMHGHEAYTGDRTKAALVRFADSLAPTAGEPHVRHKDLVRAPAMRGCEVAGFVLVNKVPGTMHIAARDEAQSFDHSTMNMTHYVNSLHFANSNQPKGTWRMVHKYHPEKAVGEWLERIDTTAPYVSEARLSTHEHYLQVVRTSIEPLGMTKHVYDVYEYTAHSHVFVTDDIPAVHFTFALSPMQILIKEVPKPWYHFLTTTCAIIGGVFTVAGIIDNLLYAGINMMKKVEIGKQG